MSQLFRLTPLTIHQKKSMTSHYIQVISGIWNSLPQPQFLEPPIILTLQNLTLLGLKIIVGKLLLREYRLRMVTIVLIQDATIHTKLTSGM